ncbi:lysophospholipid acyltransferase family protein [Amphibiibacter pelophylacis]|uniref:Lysophospholipid acyltransferase family protein n=1 Tax=Amphibiibacter pelophylacis TaxID=1799477 RepID=A0ACC6P440_9BURK
MNDTNDLAPAPWPPARQPVTPARALRAVWRGVRLLTVFAQGRLALTRFPELTPAQRDAVLMNWSRDVLRALGVQLDVAGEPAPGPVLVVANHLSWLDIMAINARTPARFVAKSEIRSWPLVGTLCALSGTLFISREKRSDARRMVSDLTQRLQQGEVMGFFPEGTTGEGNTVLRFYGNLFQSALQSGAPIQPLALRYANASGGYCPDTYFGGDVSFAQSVWRVLCAPHVTCQLRFLPALDTTPASPDTSAPDRNQLARDAHAQISATLATLDAARSTAPLAS